MLRSTLTKWNYEVVEACDGTEALAQLQSEDAPALAILDWLMPGMNGIEVCQKLREVPNPTPPYLMLLTAKSDKADIVAGLNAGADDYLSKPFEPGELRARIAVGTRVVKLQRSLADRLVQLNKTLAERVLIEKSLSESEQRYRHLVENSQGLICTHDLNGVLLSVNPAAAGILGYQPDQMIGRVLSEFIVPSHRSMFASYLERITGQPTDSGLLQVLSTSGAEHVWQYHNVRYEEEGEIRYVLGHAQDVTALKQAEAAMRSLSLRDELTGLHNRRGFFALAEHHLRVARRTKQAFLLFFADVDGLKQINDTYGHQQGSEAIRQAAEILRETFRETDIVARLGGDEFTVLAIDTSWLEPETAIRRLQEKLLRFNQHGTLPYKLSLSVGAVEIDQNVGLSLQAWLDKADQEMYEQKRRKRESSLQSYPLRIHEAVVTQARG
jgi:diguanylate cyclase (GGDEF)-like protein/PAS domain S-box-containing protein